MEINFVKMLCLAAAGAVVVATGAYGQEKKDGAEAHKIVHYADLKWIPLIKGCDMAVVDGNQNGEGTAFVIRLKCADGTKVQPHWHPTDENVTVMKGTFLVGMGETFDEAKLTPMNVGNYLAVSKEMRHFAMSKGESIVQVHGMGPFKVNWVHPADVEPPDAASSPSAKPK